MKFDGAIYKKNGEEEFVSLNNIDSRVDYLDVVDNLFCTGGGCEAKMTYNKRTTGPYLSKHKAYEHTESCPYHENETVTAKSVTEYMKELGRTSNKGIKKRKKELMSDMDAYFSSKESGEEPKTDKRPTPKKKKAKDGSTTANIVTKVEYDVEGEIIDTSNPEKKVREPTYYKFLPHQISAKDVNKNLRTSAFIQSVMVKENGKYAEILGEFENKKIRFVIPETFFQDSRRNIAPDILESYLFDLKKFVDENDVKLLITTLCHSTTIDLEDLTVYIYEPDEMGFQFVNGRKFERLTDIVIAINTKAI
ncbi:hypothetical protein [Enterococcus sp. DIV0800]|uniref:hypothetical protein n=1 Tax=unclassified Enterococcus TaxID=2608891 RepID=UPI003D2FD986